METKPSVKAVNQLSQIVEFKDRTVSVSDLATISSIVTDVSFIRCRSKEWMEIGKRLALLPQLHLVSTEHCDCEDSLCVSIYDSKSLMSLRMGKIYMFLRELSRLRQRSPTTMPQKRPTAIVTLSLLMDSKECLGISKLCQS
jgi:hypothetical protein